MKDHVVIITGAGSGIGRASALKLAEAGAKIVGAFLQLKIRVVKLFALVQEQVITGKKAMQHMPLLKKKSVVYPV